MKRLWIVALVAAVFAVAAFMDYATAKTRMKWVDLKFRTTLTSSTTPTFASVWGGGANTGAKWVDSLEFNSDGTNTETAPLVIVDTTVAFTLVDLQPYMTSDSVDAFADTSIAITFVMYPNKITNTVPEQSTVNWAYLQGSMNGTDWCDATLKADSTRFAETVSANDVWTLALRSVNVQQGALAKSNWWRFKLYRLVIIHPDAQGTWKLKMGYLANVPED